MKKMLTAFLSFVFVFIVTIQSSDKSETRSVEHGKNCHCQCCMRAFHS